MRYEKEVSFRYIGDRAECQKYVARARVVLGEVYNRDIDIGGLEQAWRRVALPDGPIITVHANNWMPLIEIDVTGKPPPPVGLPLAQLRMAWKPEGIVMTPVNDAAPEGWGLPRRLASETGEFVLDPLGTLAGLMPQVLLNRFENNKYLDKKEHISGLSTEVIDAIVPENPRLRDSVTAPHTIAGFTFCVSWQLLYNPLSVTIPPEDDGTEFWADPVNSQILGQVPGLYTLDSPTINNEEISTAQLLQPQFSDDFYTDVIFETESTVTAATAVSPAIPAAWYCHRPEDMLYAVAAYEGCFQETNRIRADAGRPPMHRQLRGDANLARMGVDEVAYSNKQYHNSLDFRPGYRSLPARALNAVGRGIAGENLLIQNTFPFGDEESGRTAAKAWEASPPHYANQILSAWDDDDDVPGAAHHVSHVGAYVDDTVTTGPIDPAITGTEIAQVFTKREWWLPPTNHHHENQYGVTGFFSSQQTHGREQFFPIPYVTFNKHVYKIGNYDGDTHFHGVLGVAAYKETIPAATGQELVETLMLRVVTVSIDPALIDEPLGEMTFEVLIRAVRLTEQWPAYDTDWELEGSYVFANTVGWFPFPNSAVKFAPEGDKFIFSMLKTTESYNSALDVNAHDFENDRSATVRARKTIQQNFVEYENGVFTFDSVKEPKVYITCTTTDAGGNFHENIYERSLSTTVKMFADYDADGELQYVYASVDEHTYQRWGANNAVDPVTESHGYRLRKLIFPSGKEVTYLQQYFQDSDSEQRVDKIVAKNWPGVPSEGSYIRRIEHLDVITEDIVYHHIEWTTLFHQEFSDAYALSNGVSHVAVDLGFEDLSTGAERIQEILWVGDYEEKQKQYNMFGLHVESTNRPNEDPYGATDPGLDPHRHVSIELATGIYGMDQSPQSWWAYVPDAGGFYIPTRNVFPSPYSFYANAGSTPPDLIVYTGAGNVDSMYGRPPHDDYFASVAPGLSGFNGGDNTYVLWNPLVWGSLQVSNIAPGMSSDWNVACKIVRYRDRIVIRMKTFRKPYALPTTPYWPPTPEDLDDAYTNVPQDLDVVLYTNFDLDEAVGMVDVTDIYPFGRV